MEIAGGVSNICVVPPGFRFHPTDEELLYYYLRKKVSYESIDLDVIREVDLNKLEPWDLKEKCRIGSGPQNEWYFFSHKDKKYPTGTRTNRATAAGFWKATGRDKAIYLTSNSKRIGMRKTLVFYTGRAPQGQKTDWIMHEYRLLEDDQIANYTPDVQEDGWVVCRVFKKKIHSNRTFEPHEVVDDDHHHPKEDHQVQQYYNNMVTADDNQVMTTKMVTMMKASAGSTLDQTAKLYDCCTFDGSSNTSSNNSMQHHHRHHQYLPQLLSSSGGGSPDHYSASHIYQPPPDPFMISPNYQGMINNKDNNTTMDIIECSQNLLRLTSAASSSNGALLQQQQQERFATDWSFLDRLLASSSHSHHQHLSQPHKSNLHPSLSTAAQHALELSAHQRFPFQYLGFENDIFKSPK